MFVQIVSNTFVEFQQLIKPVNYYSHVMCQCPEGVLDGETATMTDDTPHPMLEPIKAPTPTAPRAAFVASRAGGPPINILFAATPVTARLLLAFVAYWSRRSCQSCLLQFHGYAGFGVPTMTGSRSFWLYCLSALSFDFANSHQYHSDTYGKSAHTNAQHRGS